MGKGDYKLLALDMDGTFLTDDKTVSKENRAAIIAAERAGVKVMFATGRGIQNVQAYIEELKLEAPIITVNGSEVWAAPGKLHSRILLDPAIMSDLHAIAVEYDTWFWAYAVGEIYNKERWVEAIDAHQWLKFGYYYEDESILSAIRAKLEAWDLLEITNSHPLNLELNPKGINKASGVRQVCEMFGFDMSQVIAMGDSLNDISMIREAGLGVAMGNAQDEVKALADVVTVTNEEHGVAKIIETYILS
ncbi:Cof-type HAD-IIB family hydrolase [Paenibacillus agricola]|uniref:HAD family phosphatase n=1 Tax=Paenibacillus agricola TaxID=2716264 RepID=A0ABX0J8E9_9BACL|nr:Cof-type HAD-IIB family hydrolase [Paenibacillus agricola]NHN30399.1 HAD family phosphatase [Paenibacillus agricola]